MTRRQRRPTSKLNGQPDFLDGNGDGQACADPDDGDFTGGPSAGPGGPSAGAEITCGSFSNDQAAAQTYFDANGQPGNLDGNGDGQACADPEDGDFTGTGPSAGPEDGSESTTADEAGEADEATDDSNVVSGLPETGTGSYSPQASTGIVMLLALSIVAGAGALHGARTIRR